MGSADYLVTPLAAVIPFLVGARIARNEGLWEMRWQGATLACVGQIIAGALLSLMVHFRVGEWFGLTIVMWLAVAGYWWLNGDAIEESHEN